MLIVCPSCATSYDVKPASMPAHGRQVRCLRCQTIWHGEPSKADKLLAAAAAIATHPGLAEANVEPAAMAEADSGSAWSDHSADRPSDYDQTADGESSAATADAERGPATADDMSSEPPGGILEVEAPPTVPVDLDEGRPAIDIDADRSAAHREPVAEDIETVAARRQRNKSSRRALRWPLSHLYTGALALLLIDAFLVGWRSDVVWALPQTASFYALIGMPVNLRGLTFDSVVTTTEQHEGVPILVVEGDVVNTGRKIVDVPRLKFVVRNAARQEIYSWTAVPSRTLLPPGEAVSFRTRLASPPPDVHDLILRFVNRRDLTSGTH